MNSSLSIVLSGRDRSSRVFIEWMQPFGLSIVDCLIPSVTKKYAAMMVTIDKHIKLATGNQGIELTFLPAKEFRIRRGIRHVAGHIDHIVYEHAWVGKENDSSPRGRLTSTASGPTFPDSR